jgi:exocyst complex protein 7
LAEAQNNVDLAALDAVRCIEHTMVVVSGEKSVYRCVVAPSSNMMGSSSGEQQNHSGEDGNRTSALDPRYQSALIASYSYVVSAAVDRLLDLIEYTFLREARCGTTLGASVGGDAAAPAGGGGAAAGGDIDIRAAASAAAAGLRIVDGVRMLGPSLSKLCELSNMPGAGPVPPGSESTIASALCISLHRSTVKYCAKTLENLARAIQLDPLDGPKHRPIDARVATVSSDVVHAIRIVSPFISAYKSVSKRRALPWDPNIGENSGEMDLFVRFLVKQLLISLLGKAQNYKNDEGPDAQAKSHLFMMNNTFYLLELLAPAGDFQGSTPEGENHRINAPWFKQKMTQSFESEKQKYLTYWEVLNRHLTDVDERELSYQGNNVLSLESGRLIKSRFSGFIEDFEQVYVVHRAFTVIDPTLRANLQGCVKRCFLSRYKIFYDKYSRVQFSKKNMENYLKYTPQKLDSLIGQLFSIQ